MQTHSFIGHTAESVLRPAEIYPLSTAPGEYMWQWQPEGAEPTSGAFEHFFDCLQDARANGYEPELRMELVEVEPVGDLLPCPAVVPITRRRAS
jgi:hypothetical protein